MSGDVDPALGLENQPAAALEGTIKPGHFYAGPEAGEVGRVAPMPQVRAGLHQPNAVTKLGSRS